MRVFDLLGIFTYETHAIVLASISMQSIIIILQVLNNLKILTGLKLCITLGQLNLFPLGKGWKEL